MTADRQLTSQLKQAGIIHIAVLSGANITLLISIINIFTAKISKRVSVLINIVLIIFFTAFVSLQAPILRASISALLTHVAIMYGKRTSGIYLLFLSAFISCALFPSWITSISFQLSYAATLGLILFKYKSPFKHVLLTYCYEEIMCSISAQIFTVPIIFFYFHQISLISPITNLLISWTIAPLMFMGFIISIIAPISRILVTPFIVTAYILISWILLVVHYITKIPFSFMQFP